MLTLDLVEIDLDANGPKQQGLQQHTAAYGGRGGNAQPFELAKGNKSSEMSSTGGRCRARTALVCLHCLTAHVMPNAAKHLIMRWTFQWHGRSSNRPDTPDPHLNENDPDHCQLGIAVLGVLQACTCTAHKSALTIKSSGSQIKGPSAVQVG